MNVFVPLLLATISLATAVPAGEDDRFYRIKYNINLDEILHSERLLDNYFKCLVDKGKCTPAGADLKKKIPEALKNRCSKCTPTQKEHILKAIKYLLQNRPEMWKALEKKYDPEGVFKNTAKSDPSFSKYNIALGI